MIKWSKNKTVATVVLSLMFICFFGDFFVVKRTRLEYFHVKGFQALTGFDVKPTKKKDQFEGMNFNLDENDDVFSKEKLELEVMASKTLWLCLILILGSLVLLFFLNAKLSELMLTITMLLAFIGLLNFYLSYEDLYETIDYSLNSNAFDSFNAANKSGIALWVLILLSGALFVVNLILAIKNRSKGFKESTVVKVIDDSLFDD